MGLYCSFCGKAQIEVEKLVAGPANVCVCNECHCAMIKLFSADSEDLTQDLEVTLDVTKTEISKLADKLEKARTALGKMRAALDAAAAPATSPTNTIGA